ncbi:MAG: NUDIX hydrolase [Myxococcota bacterium]|nr:NUDIX hydrolase [Myxococcota bacterium]
MSSRGPVTRRIPPGDDRERLVCLDCGFVNYENPKVVVGSVVTAGEEILLCRRAIEPRRGYWTIPAGFLEAHEDPQTGARREAMEEATAEIAIDALLAVYSVARISQVQLIYRATLVGTFAPGPESLEVALFAWDELPWDDLAFPSVHWALRHHRSVNGQNAFAPFVNPTGETGDLLPNATTSRT